jgi:hypothetical protein
MGRRSWKREDREDTGKSDEENALVGVQAN